MPDITIDPVSLTDKPVLWRLFQLYLYEFTQYEADDINAQGEYEDEYFDAYWVEPERFPFFIHVDGKLAGFVLVRHVMENEEHPWSIAEFFVLHAYRRTGIGTTAAHTVFDMFGPLWEVCQVKENTDSVVFWLKTIEAYTNGNNTNHPDGHGYWTQGPVQHFHSRSQPSLTEI